MRVRESESFPSPRTKRPRTSLLDGPINERNSQTDGYGHECIPLLALISSLWPRSQPVGPRVPAARRDPLVENRATWLSIIDALWVPSTSRFFCSFTFRAQADMWRRRGRIPMDIITHFRPTLILTAIHNMQCLLERHGQTGHADSTLPLPRRYCGRGVGTWLRSGPAGERP